MSRPPAALRDLGPALTGEPESAAEFVAPEVMFAAAPRDEAAVKHTSDLEQRVVATLGHDELGPRVEPEQVRVGEVVAWPESAASVEGPGCACHAGSSMTGRSAGAFAACEQQPLKRRCRARAGDDDATVWDRSSGSGMMAGRRDTSVPTIPTLVADRAAALDWRRQLVDLDSWALLTNTLAWP